MASAIPASPSLPLPGGILGAASSKMPQFGFGTFQLSSEGGQCEAAVFHALKTGYRMIDTAEGYANETACAAAISRAVAEGVIGPEELFVVSKVWPGNEAWGQTVKDAAATTASCRQSVENFGGRSIEEKF